MKKAKTIKILMYDIIEYFYYLLEDEFLKIKTLIISGTLDRLTKLNRASCHHNSPLKE